MGEIPNLKKDSASIAWTKFGQWLILYRDSHPEDTRDDYELALIYPYDNKECEVCHKGFLIFLNQGAKRMCENCGHIQWVEKEK